MGRECRGSLHICAEGRAVRGLCFIMYTEEKGKEWKREHKRQKTSGNFCHCQTASRTYGIWRWPIRVRRSIPYAPYCALTVIFMWSICRNVSGFVMRTILFCAPGSHFGRERCASILIRIYKEMFRFWIFPGQTKRGRISGMFPWHGSILRFWIPPCVR